MSATLENKAVLVKGADLRDGIAVLRKIALRPRLSCLKNWINRHMPEADIESEAKNVVSGASLNPDYCKMRDRICDKYGIGEYELVRQLMVSMSQ
jgi:hypothetical protein